MSPPGLREIGHAEPPASAATPQGDHRARILQAAHRCFVRAGFHRATMQDVAAEAGMSAGNIYRYFASKDAVVSGLCEADRAELAQSFAELVNSTDPFSIFRAIGHRHLVDEPRDKAIFALDLWAEAARNPRLAQVCREFEADVRRWMAEFLSRLIAARLANPQLDVTATVDLLLCIADGVLARRAREPDFDPAPHVAHMDTLFRLACAGLIPSLLRADAAAA
jgi:AcrR family transcriptional regulator